MDKFTLKPTNAFTELLIQTVDSCKKAFVYVGLFSLFINLLMLTAPIYMLQVFDRVITSGRYETLIFLTIIAIFALLIYAALEITRSYILIKIGNWIATRLNTPALTPAAEEILQGRQYGAQSIIDINIVRQFVGGNAIFAFFDAPWAPVYLAVIFIIHPVLGWIGITGAILLFILALLNEYTTRRPIKQANTINIINQRRIDTAIRNADVIRALGMMPDLIRMWTHRNQDVLDLQQRASNLSAIITYMSRFIRFTLQILVLGVGAYFVIQSELTAGMMIAASIIMSRALAPIEQSIVSWKAMIQAQHAFQRLKQHFAYAEFPEARLSLPKPVGNLIITNVNFIPPSSSRPILKQVNFKINAGEILGIIGPTAAGKSTLLRLMIGIWRPTTGHIRLDGAEIYEWNRDELSKHIGYLPQDIELFPGTIAENIARMQEIDSEEIIKASKLADVHQLILELPNGYETKIGDKAFSLSGGQQQRIALARALFGDPAIIALDEPNSNLDSAGELALLKTLQELKRRGRTIFIVAHRTNIIQLVDKLLILQDGIIQFFGPRDEVLRKINPKLAAPKTQQP